MQMNDMKENTKNNVLGVYVGIAAIISGVSLAAIVLVGVFAPQAMSVTPWIVGALCAMGSALGYLVSKRG